MSCEQRGWLAQHHPLVWCTGKTKVANGVKEAQESLAVPWCAKKFLSLSAAAAAAAAAAEEERV